MRLFVFAFLISISASHTFAQEPPEKALFISIQGALIDSLDQSELGFATVTLIESKNPEAYQTTVSDQNGQFQFEKLQPQPYRLVITYIGYETRTITIPLTSQNINLSQILISPTYTQLNEVEVIAERPLIEQSVNGLIYNVEMDPESQTLSAFEIFRKVPMMSIGGEDNLQLNGSSSFLVLINGKPSSLFVQNPSEVFKTMPANTIKNIEVITNPPARFDAEGVGGIINVITHKKALSGYNGAVNAGLSSPTGTSLSSYLTAKTNRIGFSGNFGRKSNQAPPTTNIFYRGDKINHSQLKQIGEGINANQSYNLSGELSFEFNQNSLITGSFRLNKGNSSNDFFQFVEMIDATLNPTEAYHNLNSGKNQSQSREFGIDYQLNFSRHPAQTLNISYKIGGNYHDSFTDFAIQPIINFPAQLSITQNGSSTQDQVLQADFVLPLKTQIIELGIKSTLRQNTSDYSYRNKNFETGIFELDTDLSNSFDHELELHAAYASLRLVKNNWALSPGARIEETKVAANFHSSGSFASQYFLNLIPSLNISHKLKGNHTFRLNYTQRLERPQLYQLDPYIDLTDPRNISYGNPNLDPAVNHSFNLSYNTYIKETSLNANIIHQFASNSIQRYTTLSPNGISITTFGNIGQKQMSSLALSANTSISQRMSINLNSTTSYTKISSNFRDSPRQSEGMALTFTLNSSYRFSKNWRANGDIGFISPQILLQGKSASFISNNISIHKNFLKNKNGSLNFMVINPFQRYRRFLNEVNDPNFFQFQESFAVIREFTINFSYRFGRVSTHNPRKKTIAPSPKENILQ